MGRLFWVPFSHVALSHHLLPAPRVRPSHPPVPRAAGCHLPSDRSPGTHPWSPPHPDSGPFSATQAMSKVRLCLPGTSQTAAGGQGMAWARLLPICSPTPHLGCRLGLLSPFSITVPSCPAFRLRDDLPPLTRPHEHGSLSSLTRGLGRQSHRGRDGHGS